jgi:DNA polymerase-3 subunit alpha
MAAVGFYLSGHPLDDMVEALRRKRTTLAAEATALAMEGQEAFRMAGVVRRRQERAAGSGDRFAFVSLSDPTGEYEVLFPPESLRKCRDVLEPGRAVVSASARRPRTARSASSATTPNRWRRRRRTRSRACGSTCPRRPRTSSRCNAGWTAPGSARGGELTLVARWMGAREIERAAGGTRWTRAFRGVKTARRGECWRPL